MNNNLFIRRCEIILVSMRSMGYQSVRVNQVAKWLELEYAPAGVVVAKAVKANILKKNGGGPSSNYSLSDKCYNSLLSAINEKNDINKAASEVAKFFIESVNKTPIPTQDKHLTKITPQTKQAIDILRKIIKENDDFKAENELLKDEINRLSEIEKGYKRLKKLLDSFHV